MTRQARGPGKRLPAPVPFARPCADVRHTVSYVLVGLLALAVTVSLPFALVSLIDDLQRSHERLSYRTTATAVQDGAIRVNLDVSTIDVDEGNVTLRVTAALDCAPTCPDRARLDLFSTIDDTGSRLPVIEVLEFSADPATVSRVVNLPIRGEAIRYPFDRWTVRFSAVPLRVLADGSKQELAPDDPRGQLTIQVENRIPRMRMEGQTFARPLPEGPASIASLGVALEFERPLYLRVVTVLLVVLIGAASAYAVFLRPAQRADHQRRGAGARRLGRPRRAARDRVHLHDRRRPGAHGRDPLPPHHADPAHAVGLGGAQPGAPPQERDAPVARYARLTPSPVWCSLCAVRISAQGVEKPRTGERSDEPVIARDRAVAMCR